MRPFTLLIKPAGAMCNLRCAYCFYLDKRALFPTWRMEEDVLEKLVSSYMETEQPQYVFAWQGGEPTTLGLPFFRRVVETQKKYGYGKTVANALQTNGTLIDAEFAAFLAEYKFLVGVSLDGDAPLHDRYRCGADGAGTHARVLRGLKYLREAGCETNILTLVSAANVDSGRAVYRYLTGEGHMYLQFIPCVEHAQWGITGAQWGRFLLDTFSEWLRGDTRRVSLRHIDTALQLLAFGGVSACTVSGSCCQYFCVEHDGSVYPCDFYVEKERRLGCVGADDFSWAALWESDAYRAFGARKSDWGACADCPYLMLCSGDCPRLRAFLPGETRSHLCQGWKMFYSEALPELERMARALVPGGVPFFARTQDRNAPCFCGSGKKRKKCHPDGVRPVI